MIDYQLLLGQEIVRLGTNKLRKLVETGQAGEHLVRVALQGQDEEHELDSWAANEAATVSGETAEKAAGVMLRMGGKLTDELLRQAEAANPDVGENLRPIMPLFGLGNFGW